MRKTLYCQLPEGVEINDPEVQNLLAHLQALKPKPKTLQVKLHREIERMTWDEAERAAEIARDHIAEAALPDGRFNFPEFIRGVK